MCVICGINVGKYSSTMEHMGYNVVSVTKKTLDDPFFFPIQKHGKVNRAALLQPASCQLVACRRRPRAVPQLALDNAVEGLLRWRCQGATHRIGCARSLFRVAGLLVFFFRWDSQKIAKYTYHLGIVDATKMVMFIGWFMTTELPHERWLFVFEIWCLPPKSKGFT